MARMGQTKRSRSSRWSWLVGVILYELEALSGMPAGRGNPLCDWTREAREHSTLLYISVATDFKRCDNRTLNEG
jgi:hypothetical protein